MAICISGICWQRLTFNADGDTTKDYDVATMQEDYPTFCRLEREEMDLYLQGKKKNERTTIGAFK